MEGKRGEKKGIRVGGCVACRSRIKQIRMEAVVHGVRLIEVYKVYIALFRVPRYRNAIARICSKQFALILEFYAEAYLDRV